MASRLDVIIFTHNHEPFIEQALRSVLSQKTKFEVSLRLHDDASSDRTVEIIHRVLSDSDITWDLRQAPENRYSKGLLFFHQFIAESRTEFIAMLDGDDFWTDDGKLQAQVDALDRFPSAALCHHPVLELLSGELKPVDWPPAAYRKDLIPGSNLAIQNVISASSVVLRTSMFPPKLSSEYNNLRIGDYPMWALTTAGHDIAFLDQSMSAYRIHDSNIWASLRPEERFDRELEARIFICNNIGDADRAQWRAGLVGVITNHLGLGPTLGQAQLELDARAEALSAAQQEIRHVLSSASWRLTKPLRAANALRRRSKS